MLETSTALLVALISLLTIVGFVAWAMWRQRNRSINGEEAYHWQPEQDYDVEIQGESAMQPGFPVLKPRKTTSGNVTSETLD